MAKKKKQITAKEFDAKVEAEEDVSEYFDGDSGTKRFNIDMPIQALRELDAEAKRQGLTRQALVKSLIMRHLDEVRKEKRLIASAG